MNNLYFYIPLFLWFLIMFMGVSQGQDDSMKYLDAIYEENDVPAYELPHILETFNGQRVHSKEEWETIRKPEILQFFRQNLFGQVPIPPELIEQSYKVIQEDTAYLEGLCTRRDVVISFTNSLGIVEMPMVLFIPNQLTPPFPSIYWVNLNDYRRGKFNLKGPQEFGKTENGAPLKQLMLRGIALVSIDAEALGSRAQSTDKSIRGGVVDLHFQKNQKAPKKSEWGLISVWAYGVSAGMNYLLEDKDIHPDKIAAMGSSVGGKIAIWAAAQDERIGMVLSATSGHGGDALWKREFGETLKNMAEWLPRWLCGNAQKYAKDVQTLPIDQHMLLGTIAPRPIYIATGVHDLWADPKGQWLGAYHAAPAFNLYEPEPIPFGIDPPDLNEPIVKSKIGFHLRSGFHGLKLYDWERFMEFVEYHFMDIPIRTVHDVYYPKGKAIRHFPNKNGD